MNKFIVFAFFLSCSTHSFSQVIYPYEEIKLEKPDDYKTAEPLALSASTFLLSTPFKSKDSNREHAFQFLVKWTEKAKDYNFNMHGVLLEVADNKDLMSLVIAGMTKFCLENKALGSNPRLVQSNAIKMVLDYCDNPANNFKLKKGIRKRLEAN